MPAGNIQALFIQKRHYDTRQRRLGGGGAGGKEEGQGEQGAGLQ